MDTVTFVVTLFLVFAPGHQPSDHLTMSKEVTVPACKVVDGKWTDEDTCGIRACQKIGRDRVAEIQATDLKGAIVTCQIKE